MAGLSSEGNLRPLGDVLSFRNDIVHPKDGPSGSSTFVGLEHVEPNTGARLGSERVLLEELTGRRARFQKGDIVYGYLRPYLNKVWVAEFDGICSVDQYVLRARENVDRDYLAHYLRSSKFLQSAPISGSPGQLPRIRSGEMTGTPIPLPPLDAQRRIAAILDQADTLRRKRQASFAALDALTAASFSNFFGDPITNDRNWPRTTFGNLVTDIEGGWSPNCLDRPATEAEWGVLKLGAVTYGRYDDCAQKSLPEDLTGRPALEIRNGDLLFTRKNTHDLVAACALVRKTRPRLMFSDLIFRILLKDHKATHPEYIHALLSHTAMRKRIQNLASGAAGSMPNISKERLKSVEIVLPPFELQLSFSKAIHQIEALRDKFAVEAEAFETLFASLQHRAFRGEL